MNKRTFFIFLGVVVFLGVCILWPIGVEVGEVATEGIKGPSNELVKDCIETSPNGLVIEPRANKNLGALSVQPSPGRVQAGDCVRRTLAAVLTNVHVTVSERIQQIQLLRGIRLSGEEKEEALAFLAGQNVPEGMGKASMHWVSDELLTVMRLQEPPAAGLVGELGEIAFRPETDPVVRDYIMQHLGHLWEQFGAREEIEKSLWRAVASSDQTTPGTALIALSRGYQRDQQPENLQKVRDRALVLFQNPATGLTVRVTALAIAGEGVNQDVKTIAQELAGNEQTPLILKRVAERITGK